MQTVTYAQLRARAIIYVNNLSVTDAEWQIHINDAAKDYWNRINMTNQMYNVIETPITLQSDVAKYPLPSDFLYFVAADVDKNNTENENSNNRVSVVFLPLEYRNINRTQWSNMSNQNGYGPFAIIILDNTNFLFIPTPAATNYLLLLRYVPSTPDLTNDSSTINGINGFDVYISALAAKRVLDSRGRPSQNNDATVMAFQEFLVSGVTTRNRAMRTPIIDASIGPYSSWSGNN